MNCGGFARIRCPDCAEDWGTVLRCREKECLRFREEGRCWCSEWWIPVPVVVEIVDAAEKIEAFLPELDEMIDEGLVTVEAVRVIGYRRT